MAETWVFSGPNNTPTEAEKRLIAAAEAGEIADCRGLSKTERVVSTSLLVAVATGRYKPQGETKWSLHDNGVKLVKAAIHGRVEAANRAFPAPLFFARCRFSRGVNFINATVDGNLGFDGCLLAGESCFAGAEIAGQFNANKALFLNRGGRAVFAQDVQAMAWFMNGARVYGAFNIRSAALSGQFSANAARFLYQRSSAVLAQNVKVRDWFMDDARVYGVFEINSAVLPGQFSANGARFLNRGGPAVFAQGVQAKAWFMDVARVYGQFDVAGAVLSGQFNGNGAKFFNRNGDAINGFSAQIRGGFFLRESAFCRGRLSLESANVGHTLDVADAELDAGDGETALSLTQARIEGELRMPRHFPKGIVDLSRAHAATLIDAAFAWPKPLGLNCDGCGRLMREVRGKANDIQHLVLDGFTYDHIEYPAGHPGAPAGIVGKARIAWLCGQSARDLKQHFNPQPWRQMAKVLREMGYAKAAEEVLIEMRVRERHADGVSRREKVVNWLLENLADYGFNPWRTVRISLYLIALFALAYLGGARACGGLDGWDSAARLACGGQPAFVQAKFNDFEEVVQKDDAGEPKRDRYNVLQLDKARPGYPDFSAFSYSLDAFTPVLDLGAEGFWHPNTKAWWTPKWLKGWKEGLAIPIGWLLYILTVVEAFLGSILTAIAISAFTGFLRPEEK